MSNNAASTNGREEIVAMRRNDGDAVVRDGQVIGNEYLIEAFVTLMMSEPHLRRMEPES
jgi:hypothetical protein